MLSALTSSVKALPLSQLIGQLKVLSRIDTDGGAPSLTVRAVEMVTAPAAEAGRWRQRHR